eukprot:1194237-Prorocentrum_lima.AAC.1
MYALPERVAWVPHPNAPDRFLMVLANSLIPEIGGEITHRELTLPLNRARAMALFSLPCPGEVYSHG